MRFRGGSRVFFFRIKKNISLFSFLSISPARHSLADAAHSSSPYVRYHWSVSATTHASPERETTARSGSE